MRIKDIEFDETWCGSGALGFVGEGYWWSRFNTLRVDQPGLTFVTKTITLNPNPGNVALNQNFRPHKIWPETLRIDFLNKKTTNKFGLANPGLAAVLKTKRLQNLERPFFVSLGATDLTADARLRAYEKMALLLKQESFSAPFGIQINYSCPNLDKVDQPTIEEKLHIAECLARLGKPIMIKVAPTVFLEEMKAYEDSQAIDAYCISNTAPSLEGGQSSGTLMANNLKLIQRIRKCGLKKPINGGGGILSLADAMNYRQAGADSVFLWSVTLLRPWRAGNIVNYYRKRSD